MPLTMAGPAASIEPPCAGWPFTVGNSRAVSVSQRILPVLDEYARKCPSREPEKTAPGIAVTAADCAGEQSVRAASQPVEGAALHTILPLCRSMACSPPPFFGSTVNRKPRGDLGSGTPPITTSEIAT